jgi:CRISPR-associated protein Csy2
MLPASQGLLIIPRLRVQNANAISSPLTHGFPSMTAFLGLMWALERKLAEDDIPLALDSVGVICHDHEEQVTDGYVKTFRLTRNPVDKDGSTAAISEEGRIHLDITLVFSVGIDTQRNVLGDDAQSRQALAARIADVLATLRVAGGSIVPLPRRAIKRAHPELLPLSEDAQDRAKQFLGLRRQWLPGFALVSRDDLLQRHLVSLKKINADASALDAWLDLSRFNWRPAPSGDGNDIPPDGKVVWQPDERPGWIVPIPVGYGALSPPHAAGTVQHARDQEIPLRFVESIYSVGQWISPHRLADVDDLLWYSHTDVEHGLYRCCNDYASNLTT